MNKTLYNRRTWLNREESDSTGAVVCFDGVVNYKNEFGNEIPLESRFVEISDCRHKIGLHETTDDSKEDFINKIVLLRDELDLYIEHLKK